MERPSEEQPARRGVSGAEGGVDDWGRTGASTPPPAHMSSFKSGTKEGPFFPGVADICILALQPEEHLKADGAREPEAPHLILATPRGGSEQAADSVARLSAPPTLGCWLCLNPSGGSINIL